ncbi:hypothetical protein [Thermus caliditerrae]|uniref:hypothetical protein n=1 Tax=Thermus caliditerrae TaxID=1330700 RepID=UPI001F270EAF|nr:hypothetical protein [Thermus caliditerrae]
MRKQKLEKLRQSLEARFREEWTRLFGLAAEEGGDDAVQALEALLAAHPGLEKGDEYAAIRRLGLGREYLLLGLWAMSAPWPDEEGIPLASPSRIPEPPFSREELRSLRLYLQALPAEAPGEQAVVQALLGVVALALAVHRYHAGENPAPRIRVIYETPDDGGEAP